ncbi:uncharacterized protein MONOS_127 [Monocercomonoides exilis]|uniref:uncharacterized protein n=1 Tax=Monocercomonoides exilis TaxID=2049356 RepID=UPI00355A8591|nr:hypothetical protein MONOS_127 [Monocercomonoides exilis]|eukprot:MONOS_127.1-p1 / transcript=MONOS_127.1 / gene=MONOS_127 / organism=Monocercomonoides_exilis_PA203 / gene_product=unspecified product / transcript_product=unspecified product / location=Mono_scaffold00002:239795-244518(+) / protein_length=1263 / sequence_SO=supercontig / SO=protein_coding / is_pseudo=false
MSYSSCFSQSCATSTNDKEIKTFQNEQSYNQTWFQSSLNETNHSCDYFRIHDTENQILNTPKTLISSRPFSTEHIQRSRPYTVEDSFVNDDNKKLQNCRQFLSQHCSFFTSDSPESQKTVQNSTWNLEDSISLMHLRVTSQLISLNGQGEKSSKNEKIKNSSTFNKHGTISPSRLHGVRDNSPFYTKYQFYADIGKQFIQNLKENEVAYEKKTTTMYPNLDLSSNSQRISDDVFIRNDHTNSPSMKSPSSRPSSPSPQSPIDPLIVDGIIRWKPQPTEKRQQCNDVDVEIDGKMQSIISIVQKEAMISRWTEQDKALLEHQDLSSASALFKDINEHSATSSKMGKLRRETIKQQIKEAKRHEKLFGEWVRKDWIKDNEEAGMWDEAEEKEIRKEEARKIDKVKDDDIEQITIEELRNALKYAEPSGLDEEKKKELKQQLMKVERETAKERNRAELTDLERFIMSQAKKERKLGKYVSTSNQSLTSPEQCRVSSLTSQQSPYEQYQQQIVDRLIATAKLHPKKAVIHSSSPFTQPKNDSDSKDSFSIDNSKTSQKYSFSSEKQNHLYLQYPSSVVHFRKGVDNSCPNVMITQNYSIELMEAEYPQSILLNKEQVCNEVELRKQVIVLDQMEWHNRYKDPFLNPKIKSKMKRNGENINKYLEQSTEYIKQIIHAPAFKVPMTIQSISFTNKQQYDLRLNEKSKNYSSIMPTIYDFLNSQISPSQTSYSSEKMFQDPSSYCSSIPYQNPEPSQIKKADESLDVPLTEASIINTLGQFLKANKLKENLPEENNNLDIVSQQEECQCLTSPMTDNSCESVSSSLDQLLETNITNWGSDIRVQHSYHPDIEIAADGKKVSAIQIKKREEMLDRWTKEDYKLQIDEESNPIVSEKTLFSSNELHDSHLDQRRIDLIRKQIREAKEFKRLFGEWVRKPWFVNEKEREMWDLSEKRMKERKERTQQGLKANIQNEPTIEELKSALANMEQDMTHSNENDQIVKMIIAKEIKMQQKNILKEMSVKDRYLYQIGRSKERPVFTPSDETIDMTEKSSSPVTTIPLDDLDQTNHFFHEQVIELTHPTHTDSLFITPPSPPQSSSRTSYLACDNSSLLKPSDTRFADYNKINSSPNRVTSHQTSFQSKDASVREIYSFTIQSNFFTDFYQETENENSSFVLLNDLKDKVIPIEKQTIVLDPAEWLRRFTDRIIPFKRLYKLKKRGGSIEEIFGDLLAFSVGSFSKEKKYFFCNAKGIGAEKNFYSNFTERFFKRDF